MVPIKMKNYLYPFFQVTQKSIEIQSKGNLSLFIELFVSKIYRKPFALIVNNLSEQCEFLVQQLKIKEGSTSLRQDYIIFLIGRIIAHEDINYKYITIINIVMEVGELLKLHAQKSKLKKQRDHLIKQQIKKKQKERINLDESAVKKGYIEKRKYIQKKQYQVYTEKTKKTPIVLQENVNPNTFLSRSSNYLKILERTKQKVQFQKQSFEENLKALRAYAISQKTFSISVTLQFEKQIDCEPYPFLIQSPFPISSKQVVIVLQKIKQKDEGSYSFQSIKDLNLKVLSHSQFKQKINNDSIFSRKVSQQQIKCLVKFQLFKNSKFYEGLLKKSIPVFPIDSKKVPFTLQESIESYPQYIKFVIQHYFAIAKAGLQNTFKIHTGTNQSLVANSMAIIYEQAAKLFERNKNKQNSLIKVTAKSSNSINFELYRSKTQARK